MEIRRLSVILMVGVVVSQPQMPMIPNPGPSGARVPNQTPPIRPPGNIGSDPGFRPPNGMPVAPGSRPPQNPGAPNGMPVLPGSRPQGPGGSIPAAACTAAGREAILRCFQTNGGFSMQNVVALLSDGAQGTPTRNTAQLKSAICRNQGSIIACIFSGINGLRGSQQCGIQQEFVRMEQETISLVSGIQQLCGKGPLPVPDTCHRTIQANMQQCYTKVGLSPDLFTPNTTLVFRASGPSEIIGAIIGSDAKQAGKFCRVKTQLFECMKKTIESCSGATEILALSGFEQESLQKGIDVLCHDVKVYVDGLRCFQNPSAEVQRCYNTLVNKLSDLSADQLRQSLPMSQYYNRYCQLRLQYMECERATWGKQCTKSAVGLKNEFECNLLPSTCKNDPMIQSRLQQTCAVAKFERQLRSGTSSISAQWLATTALSLMLAVFVV